MEREALTGWLRWLAVVPAMLAGWYLALITALLLLGIGERFCPAAEMVSGHCSAAWFTLFESTLTVAMAGVAALLMVLLPTLVAPAGKKRVARFAYVVGAITAIGAAIATGAWPEMVSALCAGGITLWRVSRWDAFRGATSVPRRSSSGR